MKKIFIALLYVTCLMKVQVALAMDPPSPVTILVPREHIELISVQSLAARLGISQIALANKALVQAKNITSKKVVQFKYTTGGDEVVQVEELERELDGSMNKRKDLIRSIIYFEHQPEHADHRYLYDFLAKKNCCRCPNYLFIELYICDKDKLLDSTDNFATCRAFFSDKAADDEKNKHIDTEKRLKQLAFPDVSDTIMNIGDNYNTAIIKALNKGERKKINKEASKIESVAVSTVVNTYLDEYWLELDAKPVVVNLAPSAHNNCCCLIL